MARGRLELVFSLCKCKQRGLSNSVEKGLGGLVVCSPYIPSMVIKSLTLKDPLSFPPFTTPISLARSFSPHLPGEKGLLAHWYTEMALAQN